MRLTDEQRVICASDADTIRVMAFAGTGKTSTLEANAHAHPRERMLYIAFNKSVQIEASSRFPSNVVAKTSHSLAFAKFGGPYFSKLVSDIRPFEIARILGFSDSGSQTLLVANKIGETLKAFFASAEEDIHVGLVPGGASPAERLIDANDIVKYAKKLWAKMQNPNDSGAGMVHDGYLKLYQLSHPVLPYDRILLDEAQDSNPAILDTVLNQSCRKIFVGDPHQAIYAFRGAVDAMTMIDADETFYLSQSFRFGREIASVANEILSFKGERVQIKGLGASDALTRIKPNEQHAFIGRTNGEIFRRAIDAVLAGKKIHFIGGPEGYKLDRILDTQALFARSSKKINDPFIGAFKSFEALKDYALLVDDLEIKSICFLVDEYKHQIPDMVSAIRKHNVTDQSMAHVVFTTAHKSKGLEFRQVELGSDFIDMEDVRDDMQKRNLSNSSGICDDQEINLLYVAATRAKKALGLPKSLQFLSEKSTPKKAAAFNAVSTSSTGLSSGKCKVKAA